MVLSASHNPMPDNGIKFLARGGVKLDDAMENAIEERLREPWERPLGRDVGRVSTYDSAVADYAEHLVWPPSTARSAGSGWCSTARTAPRPRSGRWRCARRVPTSSRSAPSPTA